MLNEYAKNISTELDKSGLDSLLCKAKIYVGDDDSEDTEFKWCKCIILNGPNQFGQYMVMRIRNGYYAATKCIKTLTEEEKRELLCN
jgi:hypothetical protein